MLSSAKNPSVPVQNKFTALPALKRLPKGREWTYFLRAECDARLVKIGHSVNLKWRLTGLQTQSPVQLSLVGLVEAPAGTEFVLHEALASSRSHGEWFYPTTDLEEIRSAMPKAGCIETPELVSIVARLGMSEKAVREVLVWALSTEKHLEPEEESPRRDINSVRRRIDNVVNPIPDDWMKRVAARYS